MGLVHCDICMEYKKEIVDIGCKNKHQTCKECLIKIKLKYKLCPFCRCVIKTKKRDYINDGNIRLMNALAGEIIE